MLAFMAFQTGYFRLVLVACFLHLLNNSSMTFNTVIGVKFCRITERCISSLNVPDEQ